jgi:hypothetical protein
MLMNQRLWNLPGVDLCCRPRTCKDEILILAGLKGTVSRDFLLQAIFMNLLPPVSTTQMVLKLIHEKTSVHLKRRIDSFTAGVS